MIEVYEDSSSPEPNMYCSLHCRTVLKNNETAAKSGNLHHFLSLNDCIRDGNPSNSKKKGIFHLEKKSYLLRTILNYICYY